jgi:hypothetical protein
MQCPATRSKHLPESGAAQPLGSWAGFQAQTPGSGHAARERADPVSQSRGCHVTLVIKVGQSSADESMITLIWAAAPGPGDSSTLSPSPTQQRTLDA